MIGKVLADYRYANRMGMRELAKEIGISTATLCRIEDGNPMNQATFMKLLNVLFGNHQIKKNKRRKA